MAQTPTDTQIEDGDDTEFDISIEDDTPEVDRGRAPMPDDIVQALDDDDELADFSKERAKQLKKVWHDERRAKESATRERDEAISYARRLSEQNQTYKQQLEHGERAYVGTAKTAADLSVETAEREYKDAYDSGDSDRVTQAQKKLFDAHWLSKRVGEYTPQFESGALQESAGRVDSDTSGAERKPAPNIDQKAVTWQKRNANWFQVDREMTSLAFGVHEKLVGDGYDPTSDAYYEQIDKTMRRRYPEKFAGEGKRGSTTVVASARRSTAPTKVTLTASAVALAKKFGLTPEQYAREMIKIGNASD